MGSESLVKKLVIFDVDGLILDTEHQWQITWDIVGKEMGLDGFHEFLKIVGTTGKDVSRVLEKDFGKETASLFLEKVRQIGPDRIENYLEVKPGLYELLDFLDEKRITKAVATATIREATLHRFEKVHIDGRFDLMVCGDEVQIRKPNPEIYLTVLKKAGVDAEDAVILEDSVVGVEAAYRAGVDCIMIPDLIPPTEKQQKEAKIIVKDLFQVIDILKKWGI